MIDFRLPSLGADMDEGMLVGWLVAPGDQVKRGQVIAEVESDKGIIEVECWEEGVISELLVQPGPARLSVGTPLATILPGAAEAAEVAAMSEPAEPVVPVVREPAAAPAAPRAVPGVSEPPPRRRKRRPPTTRPSAKPPVRHLAHALGVDLAAVAPSGHDGSITRDDIRRAVRPHGVKASPMARKLAAELGIDLAGVTPSRRDGLVVAEDVRALASTATAAPAKAVEPPSVEDKGAAMRRAIARSMARSKREIPHYYVGTHIDLSTAMHWLDEHNAELPITGRVLPAVLLLKATALALRATPDLNGWMVDDEFRRSEPVHLGVAVSLRGGGLVAPAIHDADRLDLAGLMEALRDIVARARGFRLRSSEMSDPTITVTNLGDRGVETAFPVIIPPQVAIVGFGRIADQPVAVDGMLAVHPVVHATLAADHRVTDGHLGALFLEELDHLLQAPEHL